MPCDTRAPLAFVFGKTAYNISTADWLGGRLESGLCRSNIVGRQTFNESQWLIGDVFLKNVYGVFDFDGSRVGLGTQPTGDEEESEASTASSASASTTAAVKPSASGGATQTAAVEGSPSPTSSAGASTSAAAESQGQGSAQGGAGVLRAPLVFAVAAAAISFFT